MPCLRLHARAGGDVGVVDAERGRKFESIAVQKRIAVSDAEGAYRQVGIQRIGGLQYHIAKYDGLSHNGMPGAVQRKIIESQAMPLADSHHGLDLRFKVGLVQSKLILRADWRAGDAGLAVDLKVGLV